MDLSFLPDLNAALNGLAAILLIAGRILIYKKRVAAHQRVMISACLVSSLFLVLYVLHKSWKGGVHTPFNATGPLKHGYYAMLATHVTLAMAVPPLAIWLIRLGLTKQFDRHKKIARWAFPIWLYVSVTGVLIYFMLYHWNPQARI